MTEEREPETEEPAAEEPREPEDRAGGDDAPLADPGQSPEAAPGA